MFDFFLMYRFLGNVEHFRNGPFNLPKVCRFHEDNRVEQEDVIKKILKHSSSNLEKSADNSLAKQDIGYNPKHFSNWLN